MATVFDSHFSAVGFPALLAQYGESIRYCPRAGGERPINAIVERDPPALFDTAGNTVLPHAIVRVYNSCRTGISSTEVDTGGDLIEMLRQIHDLQPEQFSIGQVLSQSSGVLRFTVI